MSTSNHRIRRPAGPGGLGPGPSSLLTGGEVRSLQSFSGLFIIDHLYNECSGVFGSLLRTTQALRARGHHAAVIGAGTLGAGQRDPWEGIAQPLRRLGPPSLSYFPGLATLLGRTAGKWDFCSIHSLWMYSNSAVVARCRRDDVPFMVTTHGMLNPVALRVAAGKKWIARRTFLRSLFSDAACFQALSTEEYLTLRRFGISRPICIIGNPVAMPQCAAAYTGIGRLSPESTDGSSLLYLGRLHPIKGLELLIRAWHLARPAQGWRLIIAGDGDREYRTHLEALSICAGPAAIHFIGAIVGAEKAAWLGHADAVVLPSYSEAFPMAAMEAWSCAKPVLLTSACGTWAQGSRGGALEVDASVAAIAEGIARLTNMSPRERADMGVLGQRYVATHFAGEHVAAQLEAVYAWMCGRGKPPDCLHFT